MSRPGRPALQLYARADRAMICWTLGITEHHTAVDNVLCLINLALLNYKGSKGSGLANASTFVGAHHFGFQVEDIEEIQKRIEANGGLFFFDLGNDAEKENFERKFTDPDGVIFDVSKKGWVGTER